MVTDVHTKGPYLHDVQMHIIILFYCTIRTISARIENTGPAPTAASRVSVCGRYLIYCARTSYIL